MKNLFIVFMLIGSTSFASAASKSFAKITGPYFGQTPPGIEPIPFAKGLLSNQNQIEINSVFSPRGDEFYYVTREKESERYDLRYTKLVNGLWTEPRRLKLAGDYSVVDITMSFDGKRLYFCSDKPFDWKSVDGYDIWYSIRTDSGWSNPIHLGTEINSNKRETQPSFTLTGDILFPSSRDGSIEQSADIYYAKFVDGSFLEPERLSEAINTQYNEGNSFISPDGSYILFARWGSPDDGGKGLYISFKQKDGSWSLAKNTKPILKHYGSLAALSHDGKYLLFSTRKGIYWVDVAVIDIMRDSL